MPTQGVTVDLTNTSTATGASSIGLHDRDKTCNGHAQRDGLHQLALTAPRTLIDWTTFEVDAGNTLNFNFTNSTTDLVVNRVPIGATILVDGTINGLHLGAQAGNIWFLADSGIFINGTVKANGVLAGNDRALGSEGVLLAIDSTPAVTLLRAGGSLIDLTGTVTATGAEISQAGDIIWAATSPPARTTTLQRFEYHRRSRDHRRDADGDVAVSAGNGTVTLGDVTAGDDILIRGTGTGVTTGSLSSGSGSDAFGAADQLLLDDPGLAMTAFTATPGSGHTYSTLSENEIDVVAIDADLTVSGPVIAGERERRRAPCSPWRATCSPGR